MTDVIIREWFALITLASTIICTGRAGVLTDFWMWGQSLYRLTLWDRSGMDILPNCYHIAHSWIQLMTDVNRSRKKVIWAYIFHIKLWMRLFIKKWAETSIMHHKKLGKAIYEFCDMDRFKVLYATWVDVCTCYRIFSVTIKGLHACWRWTACLQLKRLND